MTSFDTFKWRKNDSNKKEVVLFAFELLRMTISLLQLSSVNLSSRGTKAYRRIIILPFTFFILHSSSSSQNLEKMGQPDMMTISGGINFTSLVYWSDGMTARRDPFTQYASGNLMVNFLDVSMPITYSYSNQKGTFTQPFNQFSISPTYKWVKTFIGYHAMNYSSYTLAGHVFAGGGFELTPKSWKIGAMYGRLMRPTAFDEITQSDANLAYKRMGMGLTVGYEKKGYAINAIFFRAADDARSIPFIPINTLKTPMENVVASLSGKIKISDKLSAEGEYALSGLTRNTLSEEVNNTQDYYSFLMKSRTSTAYYSAYKSSLNYTVKKFNLRVQYEHVDPEYKTLGGYFFNNDLENYTLAPSLQLMQGKLNLNLNGGFQKNNLDKQRAGTTKRMIGSFNISYAPNQKWNFNAQFSNFSTFTKNRIQPDPFFQNPMDTLNFYQVSRNASATLMHLFGNEKSKQALTFTMMHMITSQATGSLEGNVIPNEEIPVMTKIYNGNLGYTLNHVKSKTGITIAINTNYTNLANLENWMAGPTINLTKSIWNNTLRMMAGSTFNYALTNSWVTGKILNHRFTLSYQPKLKNAKAGRTGINFTATLLQKLATDTQLGFMEMNGNLSLSWSF
jgi:hypothetical protein